MSLKVGEAIERIRDRINEPRAREKYSKNPERWEQICSAMDFLGDIDLALRSYLEPEVKPLDGERYLRAYGALQALVVQQDAVKHLHEAMGVPPPPLDGVLQRIRYVRSRSSGHPTDTKGVRRLSRPRLFNFISRFSLNAGGFRLTSRSGHGHEQVETVDVAALINAQDRIIAEQLSALEVFMVEDERRHRAMHAGQKLKSAFQPTLLYAFEKIGDGIRRSEMRSVALWGLQAIRTDLESFRQALEKRGLSIDAYPGIENAIQQIAFPLSQIGEYLEGRPSEITSGETAHIFLSFLQDRVLALEEMAGDIDHEYESPVE